MGILDGFFSLSKNINRTSEIETNETMEGVVSTLAPELELDISDDELIKLKNQWEADWIPYSKVLRVVQDRNENYWLGKQFGSDDKSNAVDNLIFEAQETFLPLATRQKAEPVVESNGSPEGQELAKNVRKMLIYQTDNQKLNLKIKQVVRYWSLYKLGIMKLGWSNRLGDITCAPVRPQKLILDPDSTVSECEYTGEYIGEYRKDTAQNIILKFPKVKKYIEELVKGKLGTKVQYIEWWTDDYVFWTINDRVMDKTKNPHWVYHEGMEVGNNHLPHPMKPYVFLSVFNLGLHPADDTNLIEQNIPLQDLVNKRLRQIDKNANRTNGGLAVSGDNFTKDQAANVSMAVEKGGTIYVPSGDANTAVARLQAPPLPNFVYESLIDYRNELRNIFGTRGSSPQGTINEQTVRGKMMVKAQDTDRIGGGVSVFIEQFMDRVFNWMTQLIYVYYDEPHMGYIIGRERAAEYITIQQSDFVSKLSVSVKEGSMIPRDALSQRNEAIDLWASGGIDPITFFERLDFPNPKEAARNLLLWKMDPMALFAEQPAQGQAPGMASSAPQGALQQQQQMAGDMAQVVPTPDMTTSQDMRSQDMSRQLMGQQPLN